VLVAVLVVLMTASLLFGAMLRTGRQEQQMLRNWQLRVQAIELAQAAVDRAAARLAADADFKSEIWQLDAAEMGGRDAADVTIETSERADRPLSRQIRVEVNYPAGGERRIRYRHEAMIDLPGKDTP
jgi:hypothetical protein